ncbi:MAG TPA: SIS domain-containing protein [Feifaniaceae bacterium]|nr:SIS domain-containing protein [Feifaniaceae bacterium]
MKDEEILSEIRRTLEIEAESIAKLSRDLDGDAVLKTAHAIADCRGKVILSACGTSGAAAKKIAHSLCCIERPALFLSPADAVHGGLGVLQKDDLLILISKGGNTSELTRLIPACKAKGAKLVVVSENPGSQLALSADIYLKVRVEREPCRFNMLATASTLAVIAAFDAVCIALMQLTGYTKEQFALIHPGGAVGERLLGKEQAK